MSLWICLPHALTWLGRANVSGYDAQGSDEGPSPKEPSTAQLALQPRLIS